MPGELVGVGEHFDPRHDLLFVAGDPGEFFLNGITSTPSGRTLLVAPAGRLCTIDPVTGASTLVEGVEIPEPTASCSTAGGSGPCGWRTRFGDRLAVVNSHLSTGFPPTNPTYEVVVVDATPPSDESR